MEDRRNWNRLRLFLNTRERGRHHAFWMNGIVQAWSVRDFVGTGFEAFDLGITETSGETGGGLSDSALKSSS